MFRRSSTWFVISLLCLAGAYYFWKLGDQWAAQKRAAPPAPAVAPPTASSTSATVSSATAPLPQLTPPAVTGQKENPTAFRLRNTARTLRELERRDHAVLLENALLDTEAPVNLAIPAHLRATGDPGSYIVQSRGLTDDAFRARLRDAGAAIVAYIPNNAYLVRASAVAAAQLGAQPGTQVVLSYEPYYKLKSSLLRAAVRQEALPEGSGLNLLLFADDAAATKAELAGMGAEVFAEERSTFGTIVRVTPPAQNWFALATLPGVQIVEWYSPRAMANDVSRARLGVAADTQAATNYLGLTGTNVLVAVNDSWEFTATPLPEHPDLTNRLFYGTAYSLVDSNGHATHVAGIIAGSGAVSTTVTNARGSMNPAVEGQHRGKAPAARLYAMPVSVGSRPGQDFGGGSDVSIQESAALTNALISNNSWHYQDNNRYDLAAASYDAAVRDALPYVTGSQPVLFVFAAGNAGRGGDNGLSGFPDTIQSPGTAKNVITVGAMEEPRDITNEVWICSSLNLDTNGMPICGTNTPWRGMTSDEQHVAGFSSRGNTGLDIEGEFGRFKPDVVAPGTFVLSARSQYWNEQEYYNPTNHRVSTITEEVVVGTNLQFYSVFVPENAVGLKLTVTGTADLRIRVWPGIDTSTPAAFTRTNVVNAPPDGGATFGPVNTTWAYAVGNFTAGETNTYTIVRDLITTNDQGNYFEVLSNLNNSISASAPYYYRYESGSSMAAAQVSGTLALMQEFYATKLNRTNSPALMKALLINGARQAGSLYFMQVDSLLNYQGWGLVQLPNSAPASLTNFNLGAPSSMWFEDQSPTNALATGQSRTRTVRINNFAARNDHPLRATLVWTDPPGSPAAGKKLVNDLDLIVTNLDNGEVFFGNHIEDGSNFNTPWDTNGLPHLDVVNNVENIFLGTPLGTNYTVTVRARHVNVNAVTAHADNLAQDYALVISSGDGEVAGALTVTSGPLISDDTRRVTFVGNTFDNRSVSPRPSNPGAGFLLDFQRVGANTPLLGTTNGMTNQWHFYVATNTTAFTNAAFVTFIPVDLSVPRIGVRESRLNNGTRIEADIDLYVSDDPDLLNLAPGAIAAAHKSRGRTGTEQVVLSNAVPGRLYFLGVKAEDQMAAEFSIFGVFSESPFGDEEGNVSCFNVPQVIPDRSPDNVQGQQNAARVVCPCVLEGNVRRVLVTNTIVHEHFEDLLANVAHAQAFAVLNNHRAPPDPPSPPGPYDFIYEDNGEGNITPPPLHVLLPTDGPGSLMDFVGEPRQGPWIFTFLDDAWTQTGEVQRVELQLEESNLEQNGPLRVLPPDRWTYDAINIGVGATNLTVCVAGNTGPVELYVRKGDFPTRLAFDQRRIILPPGDCLTVTPSDLPPLSPGRYYIGVYNSSLTTQTIRLYATVGYDPNAIVPIGWNTGNREPLLDDAVDTSSQDVTNDSRTAGITVTNRARIATLEVGLRVDHPRVSDLAFTLISPQGTRVLLMENRGGTNSLGIGNSFAITNVVPVTVSNSGPQAVTNVIPTGQTSGLLTIDYDFFQVADRMTVYYENTQLLDTGFISGSGQASRAYGPGSSTDVVVVMNEGGNSASNTAYTYTVSDIQVGHNYLTFTENTNRTTTPIKFLVPPFVPPSSAGPVLLGTGFETAAAGDYVATNMVDGWKVLTTNPVTVLNNPALAHTGTKSLALRAGQINRTLPTVQGHDYAMKFAYRKPPALDGLVSWWPGQSAPTDIVDGNTGTLIGNTTYGPAEVGLGFVFDGFADRVSVGNPANLRLQNFTIETWVKRSSPTICSFDQVYVNGGAVIFSYGYGGYGFGMFDNGNLFLTRIGISAAFAGTGIANVNWNHLAVTKSGSSVIFYINGIAYPSISGPYADVFTFSSPVAIGSEGDGAGATFYGGIDDLAIFNRALSAAEIKQIFDAGAAGKCGMITPPNICATTGARAFIPGMVTNTFPGTTNWQTNVLTFTATANGTPVQLAPVSGQSGVLLDTFTLTDTASSLHALPEASLRALEGENAFGTWQLEIWDSRTGATNLASLVSWQLSFVFQNDLPAPGVLLPGVLRTANIPPRQIAYYIVDAPFVARFGTNSLLAATAPLNMYFNQNLPPARGATNAGDYQFLINQTNGTVLMTTNSIPPLQPGRRYYLAVENLNPFNVTYTVMVDFDLVVLPPSILLTNGVPYCTINSASLSLDYYQVTVSSNAVRAQFAILNPSGDLTLLLRRELPPTFSVFDYVSANPGDNYEVITVFDFSQPVPLTPGDWYFAAANVSTGAVTYCVQANEWTVYGTNLVPTVVTNAPDLCITWASLPGALYYVQGSVDNINWVTISPTIQATGPSTTYCIPLPTTYNFFRVREGVATSPPVLPPYITRIQRIFTGILISWGGAANAQYQVQWKPILDGTTNWNTFTNIITSPTGFYQFLDDGSQSGGFDATRFYRLLQLP